MLSKLLVTTFFFIILASLSYGEESRIQMWSTKHCPYSCSEEKGLVSEVMQKFFTDEKIPLQLNMGPWLRIIKLSKKREVVDIFTPTLPEAAPHLWFPDYPIAYDRFCYYTRSTSNWEYKGIDSLKEIGLIVVKGYVYQVLDPEIMKYINKNEKNTKRIRFLYGDKVALRGLQKVQGSRGDVFLTSEMVSNHILSPDKRKDLRKAYCYDYNEYHVGLNKKSPKFAFLKPLIQKKLKEKILSGGYDNLLRKYQFDPQILTALIKKSSIN